GRYFAEQCTSVLISSGSSRARPSIFVTCFVATFRHPFSSLVFATAPKLGRRSPVAAFNFARVGDAARQRGCRDGRCGADPDLRFRIAETAFEVAIGTRDHDLIVT